MLSAKQIQENKEQFISLLTSDSIIGNLAGTKDLINYLEDSDFYIAPASSKYHGKEFQ